MTITLKALRKLGVVPKTTHRWNKTALQAKAEYIEKFGARQIPKGLVFTKVSPRVKSMLKSVNIDTIGTKLVFPAQNHTIRVRETKYGAIIKATNKDGASYEIILAENGDHVKYAKKLGKKNATDSWGTLKNVEYKTSDGKIKRGYMRDMSRLYGNFNGALNDERYKHDLTESDDEWNEYIGELESLDDIISDKSQPADDRKSARHERAQLMTDRGIIKRQGQYEKDTTWRNADVTAMIRFSFGD